MWIKRRCAYREQSFRMSDSGAGLLFFTGMQTVTADWKPIGRALPDKRCDLPSLRRAQGGGADKFVPREQKDLPT